MIAVYVVVLVVEFFLGVCSSLYPLVYGCVLRWRDGNWPSKEMVWGSKGGWDSVDGESDFVESDESGRDSGNGTEGLLGTIAKYTLIGMLIIGLWKVFLGNRTQRGEKRCRMLQDEKLKLLEEGQNLMRREC
jgi:hypothetical protein